MASPTRIRIPSPRACSTGLGGGSDDRGRACAFAHREHEHPGERPCERPRVLDLYRTAIDEGYRFYSYGDAMLILGRIS